MMRKTWLLNLLGLMLVLTASAQAASPILQIDSGGHNAKIQSITFTPDGKFLVSASDDKLVRVWNWQAGETVRIIRGQINIGEEGKIYAMALSPNGRWLATGGWTQNDEIRLYDFKQGRLVGLLLGHSNVTNALAFSPNSQYLVSGSHDNTAIVWDVNTQQKRHVLEGHTAEVYAVGITPDNQRVVTGSYDHDLRLWALKTGKSLAVLSGHSDNVYAVALSPRDDMIIASGSYDPTIRLWNGNNGESLKILAERDTGVGGLAFSPDGGYLLAASDDEPYHVQLWSIPAGEQLLTYKAHDNSVFATAIHPKGHLAATGGGDNNEIHVWHTQTGNTVQRLRGVGAGVWSVGFAADGQWLVWGNTGAYENENQRGPLEYQLKLPDPKDSQSTLGTPEPLTLKQPLVQAQSELGSWYMYTEEGGDYGDYAILVVEEAQTPVAQIERDSTDGYGHRGFTFTPDGQRIISSGMNGALSAYDKYGDSLGSYVGHTGDVWAVAVSPDGTLLASGSDDQTVRLWNVESLENIVTLFRGSNNQWVMWTPQGYYAASTSGDRLIGWHINQGTDKNPIYMGATELRQYFHRPDIVAAAIRLRSVEQAIAQADNTDFTLAQLLEDRAPVIQIITPQPDSHTQFNPIRMEISLLPNRHPVEKIEVYVNDTLTQSEMPLSRVQRKLFDLTLQSGMNRIDVLVRNRIGTTRESMTVHLYVSEGPGSLK